MQKEWHTATKPLTSVSVSLRFFPDPDPVPDVRPGCRSESRFFMFRIGKLHKTKRFKYSGPWSLRCSDFEM